MHFKIEVKSNEAMYSVVLFTEIQTEATRKKSPQSKRVKANEGLNILNPAERVRPNFTAKLSRILKVK